MTFKKHIAGEYINGIQHCLVCGAKLRDDRNAMVPIGSGPLVGWPADEPLYVSEGTNPTVTMVEAPDRREDEVIPCTNA